jgi:hypothetical protein
MLASFVCPPGAFSYKTAFDERYARFSPGVLLQCENLSLLARPEIDWATAARRGPPDDRPPLARAARDRPPQRRHRRRGPAPAVPRPRARETGFDPGGIA